MPLKTEINTEEMAERILEAALVHHATMNHEPRDTFEHGQHWITCPACGAQWSVVDAAGGNSVDGFDFEEVTEGDGSCSD